MNIDIFLFLHENICFGYTIEVICQRCSNEYNITFSPRNRINNYLDILLIRGWFDVAKVLYILCHRDIQLILAYCWARLAILIAGKGRGECFYFFCFFPFIPVSLSPLSLSFISSTISSISCLPFSGRWHKVTHKGWYVVQPKHNKKKTTKPSYMELWYFSCFFIKTYIVHVGTH